MTISRTAECICGQLKLHTEGDPRLVSSCSCRACQRRTGAFFGVTAYFGQDQVKGRAGKSKTYRRVAESGRWLEHHFCPACGATVFWTTERAPDAVCVAGGAFADAAFPSPQRMVWTEFRHPFVTLPEGLPTFPENAP